MATYSINQVTLLYVANAYLATPLPTSAVGTIGVTLVDSGAAAADPYFYLPYIEVAGQLRSDLVHVKNLLYAKATSAADLAIPLKRSLIELDSNVNGGAPVAGQEYILRIQISQYVGISDEDQYWKYGQVRATQGMTASQFYVQMAINLAQNLAREVEPLFNVYLTDGTTETEVTNTTDSTTLTGTYTGIIIQEVELQWRRGLMSREQAIYTVTTVPIRFGGDDLSWGVVTQETPTTLLINGKDIADLEYFAAGFKGDYYRSMDWPYNIDTTYLVDPTVQYDVINLHFFYQGPNESVQKSEKDMVIVCPAGTDPDAPDHTIANSIIAALNTAIADSGIVITTLT